MFCVKHLEANKPIDFMNTFYYFATFAVCYKNNLPFK